jgi:hypothetical protein
MERASLTRRTTIRNQYLVAAELKVDSGHRGESERGGLGDARPADIGLGQFGVRAVNPRCPVRVK